MRTMVGIDETRAPWRYRHPHAFEVVVGGAALAAAVGLGAFALHSGGINGARFAAQMVLRSATMVFVLSLLVRPLARLVRSKVTRIWAQEERNLNVAFAAFYGVVLSLVAAPYYLTGASMPFTTAAFCIFSAGILLAMFAGAFGESFGFPISTSRALRRLAKTYFWLVFTFSNLDTAMGPHRPDGGYAGFAVGLLIFTVALNVLDSVIQRVKFRSAAGTA